MHATMSLAMAGKTFCLQGQPVCDAGELGRSLIPSAYEVTLLQY